MKKRLTLLLLFATAAVLAAVALPVQEIVESLRGWTETDPLAAWLGTVGFVTLGFLLMLPASLLMMLAGFLFGLAHGLAAVWLAGLLASTLAFWAGRTVARPWIERRAHRNLVFRAIDRAVEHRGLLVVLLTRVVMLLPFPALNYLLGLTAVRFRDYLVGSNLGMLLPYFLFVYLGTTFGNLAALFAGELAPTRRELLIGTLLFAFVLAGVALATRAAWRTLRAELAGPSPGA